MYAAKERKEEGKVGPEILVQKNYHRNPIQDSVWIRRSQNAATLR
jgi:hypothetical protein